MIYRPGKKITSQCPAAGWLALMVGLLLAAEPSVFAAPDGSLSDTNIQYFGRWDFSNRTNYVSDWGGAYLKVNFTGTTVKLMTGRKSNYYAKIDGGPWISFKNAAGLVNLTPTPLAAGTHSLSV